jgi:hypothetical protein
MSKAERPYWPRKMTVATAAAYCDMGVREFNKKYAPRLIKCQDGRYIRDSIDALIDRELPSGAPSAGSDEALLEEALRGIN